MPATPGPLTHRYRPRYDHQFLHRRVMIGLVWLRQRSPRSRPGAGAIWSEQADDVKIWIVAYKIAAHAGPGGHRARSAQRAIPARSSSVAEDQSASV